MIAAGPHRSGNQKEAHVQGWLISLLLHGTVALVAILIVQQTQFTPQEEAFKWNVAMVSPPQTVTPTPSPPSQAHTPSSPSAPPTPSSHVPPTAPVQRLPPPQPPAEQTTPSMAERSHTALIAEPPVPTVSEPATPPKPVTHPPQPAEPTRHEAMPAKPVEHTSAQKMTDAPTTERETVEPHAATSPPPPAPVATSATTPSTMPATTPDATTASDTALIDAAPAPVQTAALSPPPSNAPTKRDFGWLSEAIIRRVEELKRYPASARADRAEGRVVVKAVINEDGSIGEMEVFQSSGHRVWIRLRWKP